MTEPLLSIGDKMNEHLIRIITQGYARGDVTEKEMVATIWAKCAAEDNSHMIAAMATAALFQLANARKWDLVLARPDGTRVVIHCDTEEEQTARALEIAKDPSAQAGNYCEGCGAVVDQEHKPDCSVWKEQREQP